MGKAGLAAVVAALLAASQAGCEQSTASARDAVAKASSAPRAPTPAENALAVIGNAQGHRTVDGAGAPVIFHPGWTGRIEAAAAGGERLEVYRQSRAYPGERPAEVVLGFGEIAVTVFDPGHRVQGVTVETLDGQAWSFDARSASARARVVEGTPAEKALAALGTEGAHRAVAHAGGRVVYHPGWSSRIDVTEAGGTRREVYRQTRVYHGAYPREVVLGFRDVALAAFDPDHRIGGITVRTVDGEEWSFAEDGVRCPPNCPTDGEELPSSP